MGGGIEEIEFLEPEVVQDSAPKTDRDGIPAGVLFAAMVGRGTGEVQAVAEAFADAQSAKSEPDAFLRLLCEQYPQLLPLITKLEKGEPIHPDELQALPAGGIPMPGRDLRLERKREVPPAAKTLPGIVHGTVEESGWARGEAFRAKHVAVYNANGTLDPDYDFEPPSSSVYPSFSQVERKPDSGIRAIDNDGSVVSDVGSAVISAIGSAMNSTAGFEAQSDVAPSTKTSAQL